MNWFKIISIWFAISFIVSPFIGKFLGGLTTEHPPQ